MEDFRQSRNASPASRNSSNAPSRTHTPSRLVLTAVTTETAVKTTDSPTTTSNGPVLTTAVTNQALDSPEADNVSKETSFIKEKKKGLVETV